MSEEIKVSRAIKYFILNPLNNYQGTANELILKFENAIKEINPNAHLRGTFSDCFTSFRRNEWDNEKRNPEVGLMLEYDREGTSIPELYEDFEKIDIYSLGQKLEVSIRRPNPDKWCVGSDLPYRILLIEKSDLWFPAEMTFEKRQIDVQKNEARIYIRAEIDDNKKKELEEICEKEGCKLEIRTPKKMKDLGEDGLGSEFYYEDRHHIHWSSIEPEVRLYLEWDGPDFDKKAIHMYGEVGKLLADDYKKTSLKYAKALMHQNSSAPGRVSLNQEERNQGSTFQSFVCHMNSKVPVKEGISANLAYRFFRGNCL